MILMLWNREFNYYKEQHLDTTMGKHKLKVMSSSRTKRMKSKTKDTHVEIHNDVGSNSFLDMHVHHNVGSQEGGACLDD